MSAITQILNNRQLRERSARGISSCLFGRPMPRVVKKIVQRGAWGRSDIFYRCEKCGRIAPHGICPHGCPTPVCCRCKKIRVAGDRYVAAPPHDPANDSHGFCKPCALAETPPHLRERLIAKWKEQKNGQI